MIDLRYALAAAIVGLVVPAAAAAKPIGVGAASCTCSCSTGPNGIYEMTYKAVGACSAYQGKTCNVEVSPGVIRSGTLTLCGDAEQSSSPAASRGRLSVDPGKPQKPNRNLPASAIRPDMAVNPPR